MDRGKQKEREDKRKKSVRLSSGVLGKLVKAREKITGGERLSPKPS